MQARLLSAFVLLAVLFGFTDVARWTAGRWMRGRTRALTEQSLERSEIAVRMARDLDRERLLIDAHIFATSHAEMAAIDGEIAAVRQNLRVVEAVWQNEPDKELHDRLMAEIADLRQPVETALALSRQNRDKEARQAMAAVTSRYAAIDDTLDDLIRLNHAKSLSALDRATEMQRAFGLLFAVVAAIGVIITVSVGLVVIRLARRREEDQLRYAALLEQRNSDLDAFAGRVAHDLRGPLSAIGIANSLLARRFKEDRDVERIRRSTVRMVSLIDDLLLFSRAGQKFKSGVSDPAEAVAHVCEELAPKLEAEHAELAVDVAPAHVVCSPGLFQEVLGNLVDNAIKYRRSEAPPRVEIRGHESKGRYELVVADNGVGMSEEDAAHVFEPFFRAPTSAERGGTGLGLSIVKRIIEAAGGEIAVDSQLGAGSVFTVRLPLDGAPPPA